MKDFIKRILVGIISWSFLWYIWYLFLQNQTIVQTWFLEYNFIYFIVLTIVAIFLFVFFGVYPVYYKITKASVFVIWLSLIIIWDTVLTNNISNSIFVADIVKLFGVILTLLAWTNILVTDKVKKQHSDNNIEIIEV